MEFKSTLAKEDEKHLKQHKEAVAEGYVGEDVDKVFKLIMNSNRAIEVLTSRAIYITKTIQPSITAADLKIASTMICAAASQLVLSLIEEDLISIRK